MKQKRCVELQIPHSNPQTRHTGIWSLRDLASLYTVPLSAINGLSHLTTTSTDDSKISESAHHFWIESEWPIRIRIESWSIAGPYC